ncbi:MAG: 3-oxoacyl-ACP synthase III [Pirellulaceae bacterium]
MASLYQRLRLPEGRLELMSSISERRVWPHGTLPSGPSIASCLSAIEAAEIDRPRIGCLIHASVCRDFLEPATASRVHHGVGLPADCWVYDVSNACLGLLNGIVQIATMIETGAIEAGIVVGTENSRPLLEATIDQLNTDASITRKSVKPAFASLTIGSGSCAVLLTHRRISNGGSPLEVAVSHAATDGHNLCRSDIDSAGSDMTPLMDTDSERLLAAGVAAGAAGFEKLLAEGGWDRADIDRTVCHQVGGRHRALMLETLRLPPRNDTVVYPWLGNTGSVALPLALAAAGFYQHVLPDQRISLLGIGSGINCVMMGCKWRETRIVGNLPSVEPSFADEPLSAVEA